MIGMRITFDDTPSIIEMKRALAGFEATVCYNTGAYRDIIDKPRFDFGPYVARKPVVKSGVPDFIELGYVAKSEGATISQILQDIRDLSELPKCDIPESCLIVAAPAQVGMSLQNKDYSRDMSPIITGLEIVDDTHSTGKIIQISTRFEIINK